MPFRIPAWSLFLFSGLTQYVGAAIAVGLFRVLPSAGVAWWRIAVSAIVLLAWQRPWRGRWSARELGTAAAFGVVLASMNVCFYVAIDRLPLGVGVALEFLGPVAVAAVTGRGWRERVGISLALAGVVVLAGVRLEGGFTTRTAVGLLAIFGAAAFWAAYILLGRKVAKRHSGAQGLAVGMTAGALAYLPLAFFSVGPVVSHGWRLLALAGVAVFSSVVPYAIEQVVMRRVTAARFAILLALLPVTAMTIGVVWLHQLPSWIEMLGVLAICAAIVLSSGGRPGEAPAAAVQQPAL